MTDHERLLSGRTAVVTGGARGLGKAIAKELAARGVNVALLGLEEDALARTATELPTVSRSWPVDITDDDAMVHAAEDVHRLMGPVSIVVANAGVAEAGPFLDSDPASWRRVIEVNLIGSAVTARAETAPCGVSVGIAYLNWIDTDMIRDADRYTVMRKLRSHMPQPAHAVSSVEHMAHRVVTSVERRASSVYAPGWLRSSQLVRGVLPGVITQVARRKLTHSRYTATGLLGAGGRAAGPATVRNGGRTADPR
ncbi:SDR family NAD(P)-dependent oxidoreductase [Streptomyces microflavus]|uniref:SDR family NAD(P)-dependent oxidoreductase n=1 Tax=Streptomyces microflavus TaxID=1919 RepID=UPI00382B2B3F